MAKRKIQKDDEVVVLVGRDKGKRGKVLRVIPSDQRVIVQGVNMVKRHQRADQSNPQGGIVEKESGIHISNIANEYNIDTFQEFFTNDVANNIKSKHGTASLILATNMFAHMATIGEVVSGIETLLKDDGVFVFENHYLLDVIQGGQFDTIYPVSYTHLPLPTNREV